MAKSESTLKNMILALTLIAMVSAAGLGFVYELTKEPIALSILNKKLNAIREVVPEFTNNPDDEKFRLATGDGDSLEVYPAINNGEIVGYAVSSYTNNGFSGYFSLMAGFRPDGSINGISVLEHKETPGLGTKMDEPAFKEQFSGRNPGESMLKVRNDGGDIDAITAATISSRAFCEAVQRAYNTLEKGGLQ